MVDSFCVLQVTGSDKGGGAEQVARGLFECYRSQGVKSYLAVGYKQGDENDVFWIPKDSGYGPGARLHNAVCMWLQSLDGNGRLSRMLNLWTRPKAWLDVYRGMEDFHFPGAWRLLGLAPSQPDILHCHNLHGGYFDLRALPWLSRQVPTLVTLHDAWLLSGHCAHSLDCVRWRSGCGQCPDLTLYPSVRKDATAHNWRQKKEIYQASRLYVATPSNWLMSKVADSMLAHAVVEKRVIPHGVDLTVFHPGNKDSVRVELGIAPEAQVLLFAGKGIRNNPWKDFPTFRGAIQSLAGRRGTGQVVVLVLGETAAVERIQQIEMRFLPWENDPKTTVRYYQAADLYVHATKVDTFPSTVIEALACGVPVVATAVGGIPEQVKGVATPDGRLGMGGFNRNSPEEATGLLVPPGDAESMSLAIDRLLVDGPLRVSLGANALDDARKRFDRNQQVSTYLEWYGDILKRGGANSGDHFTETGSWFRERAIR